MKKYILKQQGIRVTQQHPKLGLLTFDSDINNESEYPFFFENGFSHLFELSIISETSESKPKKYVGIKQNKKDGTSKENTNI